MMRGQAKHKSAVEILDFIVIDSDKRLVRGWANVNVKDVQSDNITAEAMAAGFMDYMCIVDGLVMFKHLNRPVGKVRQWEVGVNPKAGKIGVQVVVEFFNQYKFHQALWAGILKGVIKGFSIGADVPDPEVNQHEQDGQIVVTKIEMNELSAVFDPANPYATLDQMATMAKSRGDGNIQDLIDFLKEIKKSADDGCGNHETCTGKCGRCKSMAEKETQEPAPDVQKLMDIYGNERGKEILELLGEDDAMKLVKAKVGAETPDGEDIVELDKARKYLKPGQEAPKGVQVQQGSKGGRFYETGAGGAAKPEGQPLGPSMPGPEAFAEGAPGDPDKDSYKPESPASKGPPPEDSRDLFPIGRPAPGMTLPQVPPEPKIPKVSKLGGGPGKFGEKPLDNKAQGEIDDQIRWGNDPSAVVERLVRAYGYDQKQINDYITRATTKNKSMKKAGSVNPIVYVAKTVNAFTANDPDQVKAALKDLKGVISLDREGLEMHKDMIYYLDQGDIESAKGIWGKFKAIYCPELGMIDGVSLMKLRKTRKASEINAQALELEKAISTLRKEKAAHNLNQASLQLRDLIELKKACGNKKKAIDNIHDLTKQLETINKELKSR